VIKIEVIVPRCIFEKTEILVMILRLYRIFSFRIKWFYFNNANNLARTRHAMGMYNVPGIPVYRKILRNIKYTFSTCTVRYFVEQLFSLEFLYTRYYMLVIICCSRQIMLHQNACCGSFITTRANCFDNSYKSVLELCTLEIV
jgi:hypothetical protein